MNNMLIMKQNYVIYIFASGSDLQCIKQSLDYMLQLGWHDRVLTVHNGLKTVLWATLSSNWTMGLFSIPADLPLNERHAFSLD